MVVYSLAYAQSAQQDFQTRLTQAQTDVAALNQSGHGQKAFSEEDALAQATEAILTRYRVKDYVQLAYWEQVEQQAVRRYQDRPVRVMGAPPIPGELHPRNRGHRAPEGHLSGRRQSRDEYGPQKRELIGKLYREGVLYTQEPIEVFDPDWASLATGVAIPHGLYDLSDNGGYIQIGTSHDTTESACDSIRYWWTTYGPHRYPLADSILLLCDGGRSNSSRHYLFKQDLQRLANDLGIEIRIAHYPPYTSKYNPIEHRLFPPSLTGVSRHDL